MAFEAWMTFSCSLVISGAAELDGCSGREESASWCDCVVGGIGSAGVAKSVSETWTTNSKETV